MMFVMTVMVVWWSWWCILGLERINHLEILFESACVSAWCQLDCVNSDQLRNSQSTNVPRSAVGGRHLTVVSRNLSRFWN